MYNELKSEKVIIDLQYLFNNTDKFDENLTLYAEFMKERILSVSGMN